MALRRAGFGKIELDVNGFVRISDRLIVPLLNAHFISYQNVSRARNVGVEEALSWSSPGRWVQLESTFTWQDLRNASREGRFAGDRGKRVPNQPYLFGSWGARLRVPGMPRRGDTLEPFYFGRYVHSFHRLWPGDAMFSDTHIRTQVAQSVGVSWTVRRPRARVTSTFEVDNVADAKVFDNFGVQRPGRAFFAKVMADFE